MKKIRRIQKTFKAGKVFVGYVTVGDGGLEKILEVALALIAGGVNLLEIAVPFSDPVADGPVIQRAAMRALQNGTTLKDVLWLVKEIRKHSEIPLVLFSYFNPILVVMHTSFLKDAKEAGIDGVLIVDCLLECEPNFRKACLELDLAPIYLITPNTSVERIQKLGKAGRGFLYYVCRKGTTGIKAGFPPDLVENLEKIKKNATLPVVVGFGISTPEMVEEVLQHADGFVVASLFVKALEEGASAADLKRAAETLMTKVKS